MQRSQVLDFNARDVIEEYSSSGSYGDLDSTDELESMPFGFTTGRTESQEFTVDLSPMLKLHRISPRPFDNETFTLDIWEREYSFEQFNCPMTPSIPYRVEPIECVVINIAHLEQFPKPASPYSAKLPSIFAWFDSQSSFSSEFIPTVQTYFKSSYNRIRAHLRYYFAIAPSSDRMQNLLSMRREIPAGRILFHYIGHGFPTITSENLWSSEKRSTDFHPFKLSEIFIRLKPPTWFIFDCSNAAAVISTFRETARLKKKDKQGGIDWDDWFCICATDKNENLPSDPRMPRDFLTSCILTPVKMAIICHILQHYRVNLVSHKFPLEVTCQHLWNDRDSNKLSLTLSALTDAIAADSLSSELYHRIFRCDRLSAVMFRHFLLAQYLLKPYKVHPKAHPELPDLSMHKLWRQWSVMVDSAICTVKVPNFASDLFSKLATSFEQILKANQIDLFRPYHLTILFHMLFTEPTNDKPLFLLAEFAANPRSDPQMLTSAAVFYCLIQKLMQKDLSLSAFHSLCYLILTLLYHYPTFATEIRKEIDITSFPNNVFKTDIPEETRILIVALLANLVVTNETFQQICTSPQFLTKIREELVTAKSRRAFWLLLLIRRSFHLFSPEPADFINNGLHVQCATFIFHKASSCRAAAISTITCFLRPFECNINGQLLFMVLPTVFDASYLVRFHLLLLLKKFIVSFDSNEAIMINPPNFQFDSFTSLMSIFYRCNKFTTDKFFERIDDVVHTPNFINHAYSVALFVINLYTSDPHASVSSLAKKILSFLDRQRKAFMKKSNSRRKRYFDEDDNEQNALTNLDQNESLHQIALRNLICMQQWKLPEEAISLNQSSTFTSVISLSPQVLSAEQTPIKDTTTFQSKFESKILNNINFQNMKELRPILIDGVKKIAFNEENTDIVLSTDSYVYFLRENRTIPIECKHVSDIKFVNWTDYICVILANEEGDIFVWQPPRKYFSSSFKCSIYKPVLAVSPYEPFVIFTADQTNIITKWNIKSFTMDGQWQAKSKSQITALAVISSNQTRFVAGFKDGSLKQIVTKEKDCSIIDLSIPLQKSSIEKIVIDEEEEEAYYGLTSNGNFFTWTKSMENSSTLNFLQTTFKEFHYQQYSMFLFLPTKGTPFIQNSDGEVVYTFSSLQNVHHCAAHPCHLQYAFVIPNKENGTQVVIYSATE